VDSDFFHLKAGVSKTSSGSDRNLPSVFAIPQEEWRFNTQGRIGPPPIAFDINNDEKLEVLVGSRDRNFYALSSNGSLLWNYTTEPVVTIEGVSTMATVADVNSDGLFEVLFGALDGYLYSLNAENGSLLWRYETGEWISSSSPAVAKLDGADEVVVLFGAQEGLFCVYGRNGSLRWNYTTEYPVASSPGVADVDNDGRLEVVFGSNEDLIRSLSLDSGVLKWVTLLTGGNSVVWSNPALVDVDSDGIMEVFVATLAGQLYSLRGDNGEKTLFASFPDAEASPVVVDLDADGRKEVLITEFHGRIYCYELEMKNGLVMWMTS
jgi:outer membrane protein assembly factor BamB